LPFNPDPVPQAHYNPDPDLILKHGFFVNSFKLESRENEEVEE
jgi:hypothetical protein